VSNWVKILVAVGLLALAVGLYALRTGNVNDITDRTDYNARLKCRECGNEFTAKLDTAVRAPFKCSSCGKMAAWKLWQCSQCGATFVPEPIGDPPHPPITAPCLKCGSSLTSQMLVKDE